MNTTKALLFAAFVLAVSTLNADDRPNVLFIMSDDHTSQAIGAYGSRLAKLNPTPNIDSLAKGGMRFDYCFSMPVCHPSRICLMTGKYPFRLKSGWGSFPKVEEKNTVAQGLKRAGYATAIAGKWQLCLMKKVRLCLPLIIFIKKMF